MSIVSVMVPCVCPVFKVSLEYPELLLLFLIACVWSSYLMWNVLPVCPMYFSGKSRNFVRQMPLLFYLSVRGCCFIMSCIVFCILNAIFMSLNSFVSFIVSFSLYVKVDHFIFRCCGQCVYSVFVPCFKMLFLFFGSFRCWVCV
jgi:hypothetical protein